MRKRKEPQRARPEPAPAPPQPEDGESWDSAEFRRSALIDLAFVVAPAIVMVALGERLIGAAWFGVGTAIVVWQFWDQVRAFWRALVSPGARGTDGDDEQN